MTSVYEAMYHTPSEERLLVKILGKLAYLRWSYRVLFLSILDRVQSIIISNSMSLQSIWEVHFIWL